MTVANDPTGIAPAPVMTSDQILQHVDSVYQGLPEPVKAALDHAHTLTGGTPGSSVSSAAKAPPPDSSAIAPPPVNSTDSATSSVAPEPVTSAPPTQALSPSLGGLQVSLPAPPQKPGPMEAEHNRVAQTGSGVSQIKSPWARIPLEIGEGLVNAFVPGGAALTSFIPGTQMHHQMLLNQTGKAAEEEQAASKNAADVAHTQAETGEVTQLGNEAAARTQALENPKPTDDFELWFSQNPGKGITDYEKDVEAGKAPTSEFGLWLKTNPNGTFADYAKDLVANKKPTSAFELWLSQNPKGTYEDYEKTQTKPITADHAKELNDNFDPIAKKYGLPAGQFKEGMPAAETSQVMASINDAISKAQGGHRITIQQQAANANEQNRRDTATENEYKTVSTRLNNDFSRARTQLDNIDQARSEINSNPVGQSLGALKTLVALAGGQGSGVRITQPELNSIANGLGIKETFENWVNKQSGQGRFDTPTQKQINDALSAVEAKIKQKESTLNDTLDKLDSAKTKDDIRKIEGDYRKAQMGGSVQFKEGDTRDINGVTYVRDGVGNWSPKVK